MSDPVTPTPNKIKYGLKNVYYAKATIGTGNTASYATPVAIPGAVSLSLEAQGEREPFYADNIEYYVSVSNNGYEGDLEIALVPESFEKDILGMVTDNKAVLLEDADAEPAHFALLFQFEGDQRAKKHVLYNCTATRQSVEGETKGESIEPKTETLSLRAAPIHVAAINKDIVKGKTTDTTDSTTYNGWTSQVYVPASLSS